MSSPVVHRSLPTGKAGSGLSDWIRADVPFQVTGPGGWDLGWLQLWFGGSSTFSAGEAITNLPAGSYTVRWGAQERTVQTQRRRATEVEIED